MGSIIVQALIKVISNNPALVEQLLEAGLKLLADEVVKSAAAK